jgi:hypothetical protein
MSNYVSIAYTNEYDYHPVSIYEPDYYVHFWLDRIDVNDSPARLYCQKPSGEKYVLSIYLAPGYVEHLKESMRVGTFDWGMLYSVDPTLVDGSALIPFTMINAQVFLCERETVEND